MRPLLAALLMLPAAAGANCTEDAMLVFDASSSMAAVLDRPDRASRIEEARAALGQVLPAAAAVRRIGLVTYGAGETDDACSHVEMHFPPVPEAAAPIMEVVGAIRPDGNTALTRAVGAAAGFLGSGTVVLLTDGEETCGGAPCRLADTLAEESPGLTVHVIGFRTRNDRAFHDRRFGDVTTGAMIGEASCLAERTGGIFVTAETVEALAEALRQTLGCPLSSELVGRRRAPA